MRFQLPNHFVQPAAEAGIGRIFVLTLHLLFDGGEITAA